MINHDIITMSGVRRDDAETAEVLWMEGLSEPRLLSEALSEGRKGRKKSGGAIVEWCGKKAEMAF